MKTKLIFTILVLITTLVSCTKDGIKKPDNLIEQNKMVDILYDISLLSAIKNQNSNPRDSLNINSNKYIFTKYKIDSLQFVNSNLYYAANYKTYKIMYDQIKARLDKNKSEVDHVIKAKVKKETSLLKAKEKLRLKKEKDSIVKVKKQKQVKKADSIAKSKKKEIALKVADSLKKLKKINITRKK